VEADVSSVKKISAEQGAWPTDSEEYYKTLTSRNHHFVPIETQKKLRGVKVFVAGCGSTGGACIEPLARIGVENFILADNGEYELTNLNRQHAFKENIGDNKAQFHAECLKSINPNINVKFYHEGVSLENIDSSVEWADIIIDAIDVTSASGIAMKLTLHERCHRVRKPVLTALDIGFRQWGRSYDYRDKGLEILNGSFAKAKSAQHPLKVLFSIVPLSAVPNHSLKLVEDLLVKKNVSASQLGCASDLLSAIIVPVLIQFVETGTLAAGWNIDLHFLAKPRGQRWREALASFSTRRKVRKLLAATS
jgi:ThiF family protein